MTRQLLADPSTVATTQRGGQPTRCIQCNQKCLEGIYGHAHGGHVECVVNPRTGREASWDAVPDLEPATISRTVLVVGGGPAGMHFATLASNRGHDVTLREAGADLGGQLTLAAQGILEPFGRAREDLISQLEATDVVIERESPVSTADLEALREFDTVVVATGASQTTATRSFEGDVIDALDVLRGTETGDHTLLIDENRWIITMQVGLELAGRGVDLEIVTDDHYPGFRTEQPTLPSLVAGLQAHNVTFTGNHEVDAVTADGVVELRNTLTGESATRHPDTVVYAGRREAKEDLYLALDEHHPEVYRLGDAISPRKLDRAYYDAEKLARQL